MSATKIGVGETFSGFCQFCEKDISEGPVVFRRYQTVFVRTGDGRIHEIISGLAGRKLRHPQKIKDAELALAAQSEAQNALAEAAARARIEAGLFNEPEKFGDDREDTNPQE